ncbi:VWA domain-containing protein [Sulfurimonas sp. HSL-1716]|uniref:vWA domain-containing protein n=1 Tax=Hydrocurvibacter sulfurireducens TaxID=3131937 RepID=UPI0031F77F2B
MTFLHPEFIYYMLLPLIALFALLLTQKDRHALFFSEETMEKLRINSKRMSLRVRNVLFFIIGLLLILSLAQPVVPNGKVEIKAKSADIMIALDISDSMLATDVYPSRLELAKHKILDLLKIAPNERIGVVAFAKSSYLVSPLSFDHDAVSFLTKQLEPESITEKGTDLLQLLYSVNDNLKKQKNRYLLLLSDGGDKKDFSKEIAYAKAHNITVFILALGTKKGAPIKEEDGFITQNGKIIISKLNESVSSLATSTGGVYIEGVNSDRDVKEMLKEIRSRSKQKTLKSETITRYIPLFYIPVGFALFLLLIATSSMGRRETVNVPGAFLIALFLSASVPSYAGIMDFKLVDDAKKSYEKGDYKKSSLLYDKYVKEHDTNEANYNLASALYKDKKYKKASHLYNSVHFADKKKQAGVLYNLANSYAKSGKLQEALDTYNKSLSLKDDEDAKINRDIIEKLLKKRKNKKQNQQNKKQQQNKQNNQNNKSGQNNQKDQNKQGQNKNGQDQNKQNGKNNKNSDNQGSQNKQNQKEQNKNGQNDSKKSSKAADQEKKEKQQDQQNKNAQNKGKQSQNDTQELTGTQKSDKEKQQDQQTGSDASSAKKGSMSDKEEKKWIKRLNSNTPAHIYKLKAMKTDKDDENEKPW